MSNPIGELDGPTLEALVVLGQVFRELRLERGLSQRALAGRCGLSQSTISRLETGKAVGVRAAWLARLLAGLDTQVKHLPDDRHVLDRCHGFRKLRTAFDAAHGDVRRRERERARRLSLDEVLFQAEMAQRYPE